ncbi:MAG: STAS domain-containing protein [Deltaproteobacteria bacterium]|nr:STAS domain-containing protein [Deltaproteobacteria bacterium]
MSSLNVATLRCEGEMGTLELAHLGEELFRLAHRGCHRVIVDLSSVDHVDYRGLQALAARARLLKGAGGGLKLAGLTPYLAAIFRAAGVEEEFAMYRTAEEAKLSFVGSPALAVVRS